VFNISQFLNRSLTVSCQLLTLANIAFTPSFGSTNELPGHLIFAGAHPQYPNLSRDTAPPTPNVLPTHPQKSSVIPIPRLIWPMPPANIPQFTAQTNLIAKSTQLEFVVPEGL
jgi:hypothetical protein